MYIYMHVYIIGVYLPRLEAPREPPLLQPHQRRAHRHQHVEHTRPLVECLARRRHGRERTVHPERRKNLALKNVLFLMFYEETKKTSSRREKNSK